MIGNQQHAVVFDSLAGTYDRDFSYRAPAQWLRSMVIRRIEALLPCEAHILEIGCGTGEDAIRMAGLGHSVVATDISEAMLGETRRKLGSASARVRESVRTGVLDAANPASTTIRFQQDFDLVFANFGVMNCVADRKPLFDYACDHMNGGAYLALTIMGRFCAWETFGFAVRGDFNRASRRWKGHNEWAKNGVAQDVWYPTVRAIKQDAAPRLQPVALFGIGGLLPSTEFFGVCERWPGLFRRLAGVDHAISGWWPMTRLSDHFLIIFRKGSE